MFSYDLQDAVAQRDREIEREAERLIREQGMALFPAIKKAAKIVRERRHQEHLRKTGFIHHVQQNW